MKKLGLILLAASVLAGCGSDDDVNLTIKISEIEVGPDNNLWIAMDDETNPRIQVLEQETQSSDTILLDQPARAIKFYRSNDADYYAMQLVASDYSSSQLAIGNVNGDRTATSGYGVQSKSGYTINTHGNTLYHIGKFDIDTLTKYNMDIGFSQSVWNYSPNDDASDSANTYTIVHSSNNNAYVIRYGNASFLTVDTSAIDEASFILGRTDLSAYNQEEKNNPGMSDGVVLNDKLYVLMQRQDATWTAGVAYVAVFDISDEENPVEIDTDPSNEGLKGIELGCRNPNNLHVNGTDIYVVCHGVYSAQNTGIEKINTSDYSVTSIADHTTFSNLVLSEDQTNHISDLAFDSEQGYISVNINSGYDLIESHIFTLDTQTDEIGEKISL